MITLNDISIDILKELLGNIFQYDEKEVEESVRDIVEYLNNFPSNLKYLTKVFDEYCGNKGMISLIDDYIIRDGTLNYVFSFYWQEQKYSYSYTATDEYLYCILLVMSICDGGHYNIADKDEQVSDYEEVIAGLHEHLEEGTDKNISDFYNL